MKKTKLLIPIILVFLFIFCSIFTVFLFKNDTTIDATITSSKPNSSFIMADDKYCEVNVEYKINDNIKTYKTKLSGLNHKEGETVRLYEYKGRTFTFGEYSAIVCFDMSLLLCSVLLFMTYIEEKNTKTKTPRD